jgi:hypothetical protein
VSSSAEIVEVTIDLEKIRRLLRISRKVRHEQCQIRNTGINTQSFNAQMMSHAKKYQELSESYDLN